MTDCPDVRDYGPFGNRQYVLFIDDEPVSHACVGESRYDEDDGTLEQAASLKLIWTPPDHRGHQYGRKLVVELQRLFPDIVHDGQLSSHGRKLVDELGIPHDGRTTPVSYDGAEAESKGAEAWAKWTAEYLDA
ncbi:GNAT family N-acetyltransferase [Nocardioides terrisoli]|uniref:hypothetical protein n=1 Tax=Nocardioides terrisoli TaxID=3388267 RepID=UPI00287B5DBF|nr:hypothetical protein [Nocardioides marmorisolisilvae]